MTVDEKLAALAGLCEAPRLGADGVCGACCFARRVTTRIAAADSHVQTTLAVCSYRQRLVAPLLDLHEVSNPGVPRGELGKLSESEQVKRAFAEAPDEERQAFVTLIESLFAQLPPPAAA